MGLGLHGDETRLAGYKCLGKSFRKRAACSIGGGVEQEGAGAAGGIEHALGERGVPGRSGSAVVRRSSASAPSTSW